MSKPKTKKAVEQNAVDQAEHIALLAAEHNASLSQARLAHAHTRRQLQAASAELAAAKAAESSRHAADALANDVKNAIADADAAMRALADLTLAIRKTHNLSEHHAIDSATGAIISPGA